MRWRKKKYIYKDLEEWRWRRTNQAKESTCSQYTLEFLLLLQICLGFYFNKAETEGGKYLPSPKPSLFSLLESDGLLLLEGKQVCLDQTEKEFLNC